MIWVKMALLVIAVCAIYEGAQEESANWGAVCGFFTALYIFSTAA